jgi:hypothetical protein
MDLLIVMLRGMLMARLLEALMPKNVLMVVYFGNKWEALLKALVGSHLLHETVSFYLSSIVAMKL